MHRRRTWVALICISAVVAGCRRQADAPVAERQDEIVPVGAIVARTAPIRAVIHASGVVVPAEGAEFLVRPPEPARIVDVTKAEGDSVSSGEVLARFELPSAAQDVARLAADLAAAQAQYENARINQARLRDFVEKGLVPRRDLDNADRELADAQLTVNRARAAHAAGEAAAARAVVRAPFNGIVATRRYAPGEMVTTTGADPVLRIVDPKRLEIVANVTETDIARVVPGATARLAGEVGGQPVRLTVAGRLPVAAGMGDTLPVRLVFAEETALAVDTRVEIDIDAEEREDTVLLPAAAIIRDGAQQVVFIANGTKAERRVVTTGIADDERIEIRDGVKPGEMVITRGHVGLTDGATISVDVE